MVKDNMNAKEALSYAIHAEIEANEFYLNWALNTSDAAAKKELEELADWEAKHRDQLTSIYEKRFNEKFQPVPGLTVEPALKVKTDEFKDVYNVLRIASTAYITELTSSEYYSDLAKKFIEDKELNKLFSDLSDMEKSHMQIMLERYLRLREDLNGPLML
ncbi:ferritin family protein [Coprothermobacter platensis]|uniref:ferritin family protein n=1 Tax=Coprothermobacter platensis TaxID=108819 RepID=UPI000376EC23|nr:ferritin family protein [Coprothermobacter platensis]